MQSSCCSLPGDEHVSCVSQYLLIPPVLPTELSSKTTDLAGRSPSVWLPAEVYYQVTVLLFDVVMSSPGCECLDSRKTRYHTHGNPHYLNEESVTSLTHANLAYI